MNKFREYVKEQVDIHTRIRDYQIEKCSDKFREQLINEITDDFVEYAKPFIKNSIKNKTLRVLSTINGNSYDRVDDRIYEIIKD